MLSNVFTTGAYRKEIFEILERQQESHAFLTDDFVENYLKIFSRKREYYVDRGMKSHVQITENIQPG